MFEHELHFSLFFFVLTNVLIMVYFPSIDIAYLTFGSLSTARVNFLMIASICIPLGWILSQALVRVFFYLDMGSNSCGAVFNFQEAKGEKTSNKIIIIILIILIILILFILHPGNLFVFHKAIVKLTMLIGFQFCILVLNMFQMMMIVMISSVTVQKLLLLLLRTVLLLLPLR